MIRRILLTAAALMGGLAVFLVGSRPSVAEIPPGDAAARLARAAPPGTVLELAPGIHAPLLIDRSLTVRGLPGAVVDGGIRILADGVRLEGLSVEGGENGITVHRAEGVTIQDVEVSGFSMHGIELVESSASVSDCAIHSPAGEYAQGVEVRNSNGLPRSVVRGCTIEGGREGLLTHVSRAEFLGNHVTGTTLRAIAVTEMSEGLIQGNTVEGVRGIGLFCSDVSRCEIRGNVVRDVIPEPAAGKSHEGYAAVAWYYATMRLADNVWDVRTSPPVRITHGSKLTSSFPLYLWPPGWTGALPGLVVIAIAVGLLTATRWAVEPLMRRLRRRATAPARGGGSLTATAWKVLIAGFAIQSFHMIEHGVQVWQVYVVHAENRAGFVGAHFNTEWIHLAFNLGVIAFVAWAWALARPARGPLSERLGFAGTWLLAAVVLQSYHVTEHVAKIVQHVGAGLNPAPGILGGQVGLVWFHFGINLSVYLGIAIPAAVLTRRWLRERREQVLHAEPASVLATP